MHTILSVRARMQRHARPLRLKAMAAARLLPSLAFQPVAAFAPAFLFAGDAA